MRQHRVEFLHNWKYTTKRCEFLDFVCIFAMSIVEFSCLFCNTKISEFFDMENPGPLGFAACQSKNFLLLRYLKSLIYNSVAEFKSKK